MAQRTEVVLTCDVHDGFAEAAETLALVLDGRSSECDLCPPHAAELRRTMAIWSSRARRVQQEATAADRPGRLRSARTGPVRGRAKEHLERMLAAAEEVFADRGYDATTTNLIAARAEASVGSVYNLLGSKEAIAATLFERYLAELRPRFDDVVLDRTGVPGLVDLAYGFLQERPALRPLLHHRWGSDELRAARSRFQAVLAVAVERRIAADRRFPDPVRRRTAAQLCAAMVWSLAAEASEMPGHDRLVRLAELKLALGVYLSAGAAAA